MPTLMTEGQFILFMTRSWISDTPDEVEHPPIPLGLNRMAVPRAALVLSLFTGVSIILSSVWIGISARSFLDDIEALSILRSELVAAGFDIFSLSQSRPSLDDVYLQATGKTLMDAELEVANQRDLKKEAKQAMR